MPIFKPKTQNLLLTVSLCVFAVINVFLFIVLTSLDQDDFSFIKLLLVCLGGGLFLFYINLVFQRRKLYVNWCIELAALSLIFIFFLTIIVIFSPIPTHNEFGDELWHKTILLLFLFYSYSIPIGLFILGYIWEKVE